MESSPTSQDILEPLKIFEAGNSERMADGVFVASACHGRFSSAPLQLWRSLSVDRRIAWDVPKDIYRTILYLPN